MKIPRGIVEDVLVQVNYFYLPIEFVVLDTEPATKGPNMFQSSWADHSLLLPMLSSIVGMASCILYLKT